MKKSVLVITNNATCNTNFQGAAHLEKYFVDNKWEISDSLEDGDYEYVIFHGCGVLMAFLNKCINTLKMLQALKFPMEKVYILGCIAKIYYNELKEYVPEENLIEKAHEKQLDEIFHNHISINDIKPINSMNLPVSPDREIFYIKIAEGCLKECTYCVIKNAMPKFKSTPKESIIEQFKIALLNNKRHIFFIAEDSLCYGYDTGITIFEVINEMIKIDPNFTLAIDQFHTRWFLKYYEHIVWLCENGYIDKLYLSIQHVNNDILKRMGRKSDFNEIYIKIKELKRRFSNIDFYTDFIVGFPGETEEQHQQIVDFIKQDNCFTCIQHIAYSDSKYASSYHFPNKISQSVITKRWMTINNLSKSKSLYREKSDHQSGDKKFLDDITQLVVLKQDYQICKNSYNILKEL